MKRTCKRSGVGGWIVAITALMGVSCGPEGGDDNRFIGRAAAAVPPRRSVAPRQPVQAATPPVAPRARAGLSSVLIPGVPFVKQKPDFCGEACVEMALRKLGHATTQDDVFNISQIDPALGRGALAKELVRGIRRLGFDPGKVWYRINRRRPRPQLQAQFEKLHADLAAGVPSIVCNRYDDSPGATQHFRLVVGYDQARDEVIYHEPAVDRGGYQRMKRDRFFALWHLRYKPGKNILIRMPLRPVKIVAPPPVGARRAPAEYAQHVMKLKGIFAKLRGRFKVQIQEPFVVVGDGWRGDIRKYSRGLIKWSVGELKKHYFSKDPERIVTIWLFKDRKSYLTNNYRLFGEHPGTPFGFYTKSFNSLVMNIRTGGGTLVHEIVHPFMEANFPACPPWFNEGMGSLYEGVGRRNHRIWGYLNWRLPGLQRAIRKGPIMSFEDLMKQNDVQFYNHDPGTNYAQSRYLLYYLQDRGLLRTYYKQFLAGRRTDPTGYETLKKLLGLTDMKAFQKKWEAYVMKQKYTRIKTK